MDRRSFLATAGTAGLGLLVLGRPEEDTELQPVVARRPTLEDEVDAPYRRDLKVFKRLRPDWRTWVHKYRVPEGNLVVADASNGDLLAVLPYRGDWTDDAHWHDPDAARLLQGQEFSGILGSKRSKLEKLFTEEGRPISAVQGQRRWVWQNAPTEGRFIHTVRRIAPQYGLSPRALSIAAPESGFHTTIDSEADASGWFQWTRENWRNMRRVAPYEMYQYDRFAQAEHTSAWLRLMQGIFDSPLMAISGYHAGASTVGKALILAGELGIDGSNAERYLQVADLFAYVRNRRDTIPDTHANRELRETLKDIDGIYGPRSWRYTSLAVAAEEIIQDVLAEIAQDDVHLLDPQRRIPKGEVSSATGLIGGELELLNPHVKNYAGPGEPLYAPHEHRLDAPDVTYWKADEMDSGVRDILRAWDLMHWENRIWNPAAASVVDGFIDDFRSTGTRQGAVFSTVLGGMVRHHLDDGIRHEFLTEYRDDPARKEMTAKLYEEMHN